MADSSSSSTPQELMTRGELTSSAVPKNDAVVTYDILSADLVSCPSAPAIFAESSGLQPMFAKRNEVGKAIPNTPIKKNKPTIRQGLIASPHYCKQS
jgi:hypothetical protein